MGYTDYDVRDDLDGNGPYIVSLDGSPIPTEDEVNTFYSDYLASPDRITEQRDAAKHEVDSSAEKARLRYITNGAGQSMAYQEKSEEAADFIAAGYPTGSPQGSPIGSVGSPISLPGYPFIEAEVRATGKTAKQVADDIVAQKAAWVAVGALIEEVRLGGKKAIDEAIDSADIEDVKNDTIAILEAI